MHKLLNARILHTYNYIYSFTLSTETSRTVLQNCDQLAATISKSFGPPGRAFDPREGTPYRPTARGFSGRRGMRNAQSRDRFRRVPRTESFNVCLVKEVPLPQPVTASLLLGVAVLEVSHDDSSDTIEYRLQQLVGAYGPYEGFSLLAAYGRQVVSCAIDVASLTLSTIKSLVGQGKLYVMVHKPKVSTCT